jgi:hypothetical protein
MKTKYKVKRGRIEIKEKKMESKEKLEKSRLIKKST